MKTSDFYYDLDERLIAQTPIEKRDMSRLLVYDRQTKQVEHRIFLEITEYLRPGDALVINETKVLPARLYGIKKGTGRECEFLLLRRLSLDEWDVILKPGRKLKIGDTVVFSDDLYAEILKKKQDGVTEVRFLFDGVFEEILDRLGEMPLPPYIHEKLEDKSRYQTVYAKDEGSAAAPTAGLHFTPGLLQKIEESGVAVARLTLHVGLGTFRPVKTKNIEDHIMHEEYYSVPETAAEAINSARNKGGRVVAVGTTSVRTLESVAGHDGVISAGSGYTGIFITPGYRFKAVDALITNFHLPESTLLMLVSALAGREETLALYKTAVEERYRFFSFGDAMLIL
ncbi:MAG: tRNA preQ1(34) S-adenosylmethionine ribosyltransferase-isomerase QueA [Eubacteriales bacterium]|nr:tRNA preQ1(34) S-adenosylmethionine ribosyltransferase-isomerase QueA [Eubacteriales bacterium]